MTGPIKYDDASWHYGGDFPKGIPQSNGALHIGVFLAWMLLHGYGSETATKGKSVFLDPILERSVPPGRWMMQRMGEKFVDSWLSDAGNAFARSYYPVGDATPRADDYYSDYCTLFGSGLDMYKATDGWDTYDKTAPLIARRHRAWDWRQRPFWKRIFP